MKNGSKAEGKRRKTAADRDTLEAWLKEAKGAAKRKMTTAKIMKLTRGD